LEANGENRANLAPKKGEKPEAEACMYMDGASLILA